MSLLNSTYKSQSALANFSRTGNNPEIPGVITDRLHHYRRLIRNIFDDSLSSAFPLTKNLLSEEEWEISVSDFMKDHSSASPQIWTMPREFAEYFTEINLRLVKKYPFIKELLWFEWLEVKLYMMTDKTVNYKTKESLINDKLVLNPENTLVHFEYPVHLKNAKQITVAYKSNYFLVMHRHPESGKILFTDLSPALFRIIEILDGKPVSFLDILDKISDEFNIPVNDQMTDFIRKFIKNSIRKRLILGYDSSLDRVRLN
ncbi:MAG: putative DNA-binding domain-containing protein [Bacteroidales bacterium]|nr:putative DNA-binding domain-containing protein [Bacteroidales bacterium]